MDSKSCLCYCVYVSLRSCFFMLHPYSIHLSLSPCLFCLCQHHAQPWSRLLYIKPLYAHCMQVSNHSLSNCSQLTLLAWLLCGLYSRTQYTTFYGDIFHLSSFILQVLSIWFCSSEVEYLESCIVHVARLVCTCILKLQQWLELYELCCDKTWSLPPCTLVWDLNTELKKQII